MTSKNSDDLLPLFLEEAGDRLEQLRDLTGELEQSPQTIVQIQRELHALKGASRMMGLRDMSEMCHRAEDLLDPAGPQTQGLIQNHVEGLLAMVETLANHGELVPEKPSDATRELNRDRRRRPREELRVPASVVDELADRGARLRVLSGTATGLADRVYNLAHLAERGARERQPRQVLATLATSLRQVALEIDAGQRSLRRLSDSQLDALLHLQVQPIRPFLANLANHATDLATSLGKRVEVKVSAADAHLDRRIIDVLREAFLHLVRNAVDHGIETPEEREKRNKNPSGRILLEASTEGDRVRLQMEDDGRGIDPDAVLDSAVRRGLIEQGEAQALAQDDVMQLLFLPGFTTCEKASEVSGRGVGLDAVVAAVRSVGGDIWIESSVNERTEVTVEVPLARRGERVLVLRCGQHEFAMAAAPVRAFRRITSANIHQENGQKVVRIGEQIVKARWLRDLFGEPEAHEGILAETMVGGSVVAIVADSIQGEEEVIVRPLPVTAGAPRVVEGITLLASGRPVPVLSPQRLGPLEAWNPVEKVTGSSPKRQIRVLLVDDSAVTREMVRRLLEQGGFSVKAVATSEEALTALEHHEFDCLVTDIEMPGMDGLALTRKVRTHPSLKDLPIVVVSTRDRPSDRLAGLDSGADAYLAKQRLDARELISLVQRVGGGV